MEIILQQQREAEEQRKGEEAKQAEAKRKADEEERKREKVAQLAEAKRKEQEQLALQKAREEAERQQREVAADKLATLTRNEKDQLIFIEYTHTFSAPKERTWTSVLAVLKDDSEPIQVADQDQGTIITELKRHGILGFPNYRKYFIAVESMPDGASRMRAKPFRYSQNMEKSRLTRLVLEPETRRSVLDEQMAEFFADVEENLRR